MTIRNFFASLLKAKQASSSAPQTQEERDAARLAEAKAWIAARETPGEGRKRKVAPIEFESPDSYVSDPKFFYLPGNIHNTNDR